MIGTVRMGRRSAGMRSAATVAVPGLPVFVVVFGFRLWPAAGRMVSGTGGTVLAGLHGGQRAARR